MILDSLLTGVMLFSSFSIRDANIQPNPDDYEISMGISHPNYFINRQWERELGSKYNDVHIWAKIEDGIYFKPEYFDKESDNVKYLKLDWRQTFIGATWGFTTRSTDETLKLYETFASVGVSKKKKYHDDKVEIELSFDGYLPPDESGENKVFEYENKFKVSWKLTDKIRLYNLGEISELKGESNYQAKIGFEYSF